MTYFKKIFLTIIFCFYIISCFAQGNLGRITFSAGGISDSRLSVSIGDPLAGSYVSSDGKTKLTIGGQAGSNPFVDSLILSSYSISTNSQSGSTTIQLTSNKNWTVNNLLPWLNITPNTGSSSSLLTLNFTENTSTSQRSGSFTVTAGSIIRTVNVIQFGKPQVGDTLELSTYSISVDKNPTNRLVDVKSNQNWVVTNPVSWVAVTPLSGSKNGTLSIAIEQNTGQARNTNITVTAGSNSKILNISQEDGSTSIFESKFDPTEFKVYPNPSVSDIHIWVNSLKANSYKVILTDNTGKLISEFISNEENSKLSLSLLAQGSYYIKLKGIDEEFEKVIKIFKSSN